MKLSEEDNRRANEFMIASRGTNIHGAPSLRDLFEDGADLTCVEYGTKYAVDELIAQRADVNAPKTGTILTPLLCAALAENKEITQSLLDSGADLHTRKPFPQYKFFTTSHDALNNSACRALLEDRGASVNDSFALHLLVSVRTVHIRAPLN